MISALAAGLQFLAVCDASTADASSAFAAGDRALAATHILEASETCADDPRHIALEAQSAWFDADFETSAERAAAAFDAAVAMQCAWTRDTARLAFIAGYSSFATGAFAEQRYYLWVASRIDREVGGLSRDARAVAAHYSEFVGSVTSYDREMIESPFLDPLVPAAAHCTEVPEVRLRGSTPPEDRLLTILEMRTNGAGRVSRVIEHYSHPRPAGAALIDSIEGRVGYSGRVRAREIYHLDPCVDRLTSIDPEPLCLPGHSETDRQGGDAG